MARGGDPPARRSAPEGGPGVSEIERTRGERETAACGLRLGRRLPPGALVALSGPLGAGKTVFVRGLAAACGIPEEAITSPSFVLAVEHPEGRPPLLHVDLYRLAPGAAIDDLGIEEAMEEGMLVAVEWGERLPDHLLEAAVRVSLEPAGPDERIVRIEGGALTPAGSSGLRG
ncbi:MAG: tRNA (adenosine(37)-N6)-threonylcarbamoyltransferase complex ATPase subunit type 1 TsaE [Acidobacteria bacterium]|nr:MAG: tRNA (adenosine(37)-N6)-threonylcarbamoyltransferase complex ATPase subunit type 1 TsaE [Acidobacteriota bacterium]